MIYILFISLCITWYFYQYFENKRTAQREEQMGKRRTSYEQLLKVLHDKNKNEEKNTDTQSTE